MKLNISQAINWASDKHNQLGAVVAVSASSLSLLLSTVYNLAPCTLCYWQRIFLYPLAFIYIGALWRDDKKTYVYALPLAVLGFGFAAYHYALQRGWIELAEACVGGVSCTSVYLEYFGFFTIPLGALLGFAAIIAISLMQLKQSPSSVSRDFGRKLQPVVLAVLAIALVVVLVLETTF